MTPISADENNGENRLQQPEIHFNGGLHRHGLAILVARAELPFRYGLDGFLVQTKTQAA